MPAGAFASRPLGDDRRLLPGDARGFGGEADFRARRPIQSAEDVDPYELSASDEFGAADTDGGAEASFSSSRVERALANADRAVPGAMPLAATRAEAGQPSFEWPSDALPLSLPSGRTNPEPLFRSPAQGRGGGLHPLLRRGVDRSDQGPRLGERTRRFFGDGRAPSDPHQAPPGPVRAGGGIADSDVELTGMQVVGEQGSPARDREEALLREQTRIPMYERASFDARDITASDAEHALFQYRESPESSVDGAPPVVGASTGEDAYEVPGRRASYLDGSRGIAAAGPGPREKRTMSSASDDDVDPEWMNGKIPDSYYDSLGLPLGGHYLDTRRMRQWGNRAATTPKAQPKRAWWRKLGSFLRGRGWR